MHQGRHRGRPIDLGRAEAASLELGGNAPALVFDNMDVEAAADGIAPACFENS
ncbi:aldehyde dehydrogenase family protein [Streptomyces sp. NPDC002057]|uniref:aldehyde dehydrogenase family protein n=1 Tax=Streptomyces sp. NPDC002057 TaxID=3154664 RepID=UPI00331E537A